MTSMLVVSLGERDALKLGILASSAIFCMQRYEFYNSAYRMSNPIHNLNNCI